MTDKPKLCILAPTTKALELANKIAESGKFDAHIWARPGFLTDEIRNCVEQSIPTLAICALGIVSRTLSTCKLPEKENTAPLICSTENGEFFIPVLAGHSGANRLATSLAEAIGGRAIVTTVSDQRFDVSLDSPPTGWRLDSTPEAFSAFMQNLLELGFADLSKAPLWVQKSSIPHKENAELKITGLYGPRKSGLISSSEQELLFYSSKHLAIGMGCERDCPASYIEELINQAETHLGFDFEWPLPAASIDLKLDETAFQELAPKMRFFKAQNLNAIAVPNPSKIVFDEVGTHSVAEASALALAGEGGQLVLPKIKNEKATLAVAISLHPIENNKIDEQGLQRPYLNIVGLGPGHEDMISGQAIHALYEADSWVGYSLYLDQADSLFPTFGKPRLDFNLGDEEARCRAALDEAAKGQRVALICSGDPQVYAMAQVVYELLARHPEREDWQRIFVETLPGITAMSALAAKVGAPMGHDFCAISLSDLNTPWDLIEKKVTAAAEADFVIGFYNPRSKKRDWQLPRALEILKQHRPANCPVAFGRNVSRPDEAITRTTLAELNPEDIDMFTCLIVGASFTQRHISQTGDYIFTPRGYTLDGKQGK